jgi:hypothetical protein
LGALPTADSEYRNSSLGASLSYRQSERISGGLSANRSVYAPASGGGQTVSDSANLSATWVISETASLTAGGGWYQSQRTVVLTGSACPLSSIFCDAGLVARVPVSLAFDTVSRGNQFSLAYAAPLDERSALSLTLQRQLSPGGAGVNVSDSFNLSLNRSLSPRFSVNALASASQTMQAGVTQASRATLYTASLTCAWTLREDLSLGAGATLRRFEGGAAGQSGQSASISISLQYQGPKIRSSR